MGPIDHAYLFYAVIHCICILLIRSMDLLSFIFNVLVISCSFPEALGLLSCIVSWLLGILHNRVRIEVSD